MQNLDILSMKIVFRDNGLSELLYFYSIMRIKILAVCQDLTVNSI